LDIDPGGMVVIFAKKLEKIRKKIITKRNNMKKGKKLGGWSKIQNHRLIIRLK
jgi:hypothetical protein